MNWLRPFEEDLTWVFNEAERVISSLPAPLDSQGLHYIGRFHVFREDKSSHNYISYLLPLWLQDYTKLSREDCRTFALANTFGMLYYHIQDEIMDDSSSNARELLPLANLLHLEFLSMYQSYFPANSPLWHYFKIYMLQWAYAVTHENTKDYFLQDQLTVSHKAALVKLSCAASLLLSNQDQHISSLSEAVDHVLLILQMLDDWADWEQDLVEGNSNCLLSLIRSELHIAQEQQLTHQEVRQALFIHGTFNKYVELAQSRHHILSTFSETVPFLFDFHESMLANLREGTAEIERELNLLQQGGLQYWLEKNTNN